MSIWGGLSSFNQSDILQDGFRRADVLGELLFEGVAREIGIGPVLRLQRLLPGRRLGELLDVGKNGCLLLVRNIRSSGDPAPVLQHDVVASVIISDTRSLGKQCE